MTVQQLIERLKTMPPHSVVYFPDGEYKGSATAVSTVQFYPMGFGRDCGTYFNYDE